MYQVAVIDDNNSDAEYVNDLLHNLAHIQRVLQQFTIMAFDFDSKAVSNLWVMI